MFTNLLFCKDKIQIKFKFESIFQIKFYQIMFGKLILKNAFILPKLPKLWGFYNVLFHYLSYLKALYQFSYRMSILAN